MSRTTIGENPLDAVIPTSQGVKKGQKPKGDVNGKEAQKLPVNKQRLTVQISEDVVERAKNAVYWTRGLTLAQLTEEALEKAISALEKNCAIFCDKTGDPLKKKGDLYPKREDTLKSGRPVK